MAKKATKRRGRKIKYWGQRHTIDPEKSEKLEKVLDRLVDVVDDIKDLMQTISEKVDVNINLSEVSEKNLEDVVGEIDEAIDCVDDAYGIIESIRDGVTDN